MERQELIVEANNCTHIKYSNLSQQRSPIMGFAALCILLFHIGTNLDIGGNWFFNIIKFLLDNGKIGVDIFLLVSGVGIYYSLQKNTVIQFYIKRIKRIVPEMLVVSVVWAILERDIKIFPIKFFQIDFITKGDLSFWYIPFILFLYCISPLIVKVAKSYRTTIMLVVISLIVNIALYYNAPVFYSRYDLCFTRFAIYCIGILFGKFSHDGIEAFAKEKKIYLYLMLFIMLESIMVFFVDHEYLLLTYAYIPVVLCLVFLGVFYRTQSYLYKFLNFIGEYSLQMYLMGIICINKIFELNINIWVKSILDVVLTILSAMMLKMVCDYIRQILKKVSVNTEKISCK